MNPLPGHSGIGQIAARQDGEIFQARIFWKYALRMLNASDDIEQVAFECGHKGLDDITIQYRKIPHYAAGLDDAGACAEHVPCKCAEHIQCKWHVKDKGVLTHQCLTDPAYINAPSYSFLQRALAAFRDDKQHGRTSLLSLYTTDRIGSNDPLLPFYRNRDNALDVEALFTKATQHPRSDASKLCRAWREHLNIDDDELRELCWRLRFYSDNTSLDTLRKELCEALTYARLRIPASTSHLFEYDGHIWEWAKRLKQHCFSRDTLREMCQQQGLFACEEPALPPVFDGIRTFEHNATPLTEGPPGEGCRKLCDLTGEFEGRDLRPGRRWQDLLPPIRDFVRTCQPTDTGELRLQLDVHLSLAFYVGSLLDNKSGREVMLRQRTLTFTWWSRTDSEDTSTLQSWEYHEEPGENATTEVACILSVTHDIAYEVKTFIRNQSLPVNRILIARLGGIDHPSAQAITSGAHAWQLAQALTRQIQQIRRSGPCSKLHIFMAAPSSLAFFLGQHHAMLSPLTLYEFDFEKSKTYQSSFSLPLSQ